MSLNEDGFNEKKERAIALYILFAFMLCKPTSIGCISSEIAMLLMIAYMFYKRHISVFKNWNIYIPVTMYFLYTTILFTVRYGFSNSFTLNQIKAFVPICIFVACCLSSLSSENISFWFKRFFILMLSFFSISYVISLILCILRGGPNSIRIFFYQMPGYSYYLDILFPFTPITSWLPFMGRRIPRLSALFRECGIAQFYYIWAFHESEYIFKKSKTIRFLLSVGIMGCLSTTGYICFMASLAMVLIFKLNNKTISLKEFLVKLIPTIIIIIGIFIFYNRFEFLNLATKSRGSLTARTDSLDYSLSQLSQNILFGTVANTEYGTTGFIQYSYRVGLIGIILYVLIYYTAFRNSENKSRFLMGTMAEVVTVAATQSVFNTPLLYLLILIPYNEHYNYYDDSP